MQWAVVDFGACIKMRGAHTNVHKRQRNGMHAKEWKALAVLRVQFAAMIMNKRLGYFYYTLKIVAPKHVRYSGGFMWKSCHRKLLGRAHKWEHGSSHG